MKLCDAQSLDHGGMLGQRRAGLSKGLRGILGTPKPQLHHAKIRQPVRVGSETRDCLAVMRFGNRELASLECCPSSGGKLRSVVHVGGVLPRTVHAMGQWNKRKPPRRMRRGSIYLVANQGLEPRTKGL